MVPVLVVLAIISQDQAELATAQAASYLCDPSLGQFDRVPPDETIVLVSVLLVTRGDFLVYSG